MQKGQKMNQNDGKKWMEGGEGKTLSANENADGSQATWSWIQQITMVHRIFFLDNAT